MTCDDFKAFTKRHPLSLTVAENAAVQNHVRGCSDCSHLVLQWMWQSKLKGEPNAERNQRIADCINAAIEADEEAKPVKIVSITVNPA